MKRLRQQFIFLIIATVTFSSFATIMPVAAIDQSVDMSLCRIIDQRDSTQCADDFYSSQPIMWYDPCAPDPVPPMASTTPGTVTTTTGPLVGNGNAEKMWLFFGSKGLTAEQIAGILGNLKQESGLDPAIIQGGAIAGPGYIPVNSVGFGIAQWTFTSRQAPLVALANSTNRPITDLSLQLDYLWQELNTTHAHALASLKGATTPEDAAYVFHRDFEGSADSPTTVALVRGGNARMYYETYKNTSSTADAGDAENFTTDPSNPLGYPTTNTPAAPANAPVSNCKPEEATGAAGGIYTDFRKDTFALYNQCVTPLYGGSWGNKRSSPGKTVCQDGAIPVALAMIAKNLTGQLVTPDKTVDYFSNRNLWSSNGGSLLDSAKTAAEAFGLKSEVVANKASVADYKTVFDKGGLVMAISTGTAPFTSNRHAIVLRGITDDGNSFVIADPRNSDANTSPKNQIAINKILTDIRTDNSSVSYAFYKK
jgi:hypothetical protein